MILFGLLYLWFLLSLNHIINLVYLHFNNSRVYKVRSTISIIIPCRNEEENIKKCLDSLLSQLKNVPNIVELIVVNDESTDKTARIIDSYSKTNFKVLSIHVTNKPKEWNGKTYACWTGAKIAKGQKLLFLDADTKILDLQNLNFSNRYSLCFVFPKYINLTIGEKILVPFKINYWFLFIIPMYLMNLNYRIANSIGFFLYIDKEDYFKVGGHKAIKESSIEDIDLAKLFVRNKYKIKAYLGQNFFSIRMYKSFKEAYSGGLRNSYYIFNKSIFRFVFLWIINFFYILFPFILFLNNRDGIIVVLFQIILFLNFIYITYKNINLINFICFALGILINFFCGIDSFKMGVLKQAFYWKGRKLN